MSTDDAFFDGPVGVGNLKLRPFSIGSMTACRKLGLSLFLGHGDALTAEEMQRQVVAFAWLQTAPLATVQRALREGTAEDFIARFEFEVMPGDLKKLEAEINRISELAAVAAVDTVSRETAPDPNEPGN
jgi:hypothetical protein